MLGERLAGDVLDSFDGSELLDEEAELVEVVDLEDEGAGEEAVFGGLYVDASEDDVLLFGDDGGDVGDDADVVVSYDAEGDGIEAVAFSCPARWYDAVAECLAESLCVGAVAAVYLDASSCCDESEDVVSVDGVAALGE